MRAILALLFALASASAWADSFSPPGGGGGTTVSISSGPPSASSFTLSGTISNVGGPLGGVPIAIFKNGIQIATVLSTPSGTWSYAVTGAYNSDIFTAAVQNYTVAVPVTASMAVPLQDVMIYQVDYTQGTLAFGDIDTRAGSIAAYYNSSGVLQTPGAGANTARFDYNPSTGASLGLLIEGTDTNAAEYSNTFSNAWWSKPNVTLTGGATTSPDATTDAWLAVPSTSNSPHNIYYATTQMIGNVTANIYVKSYLYGDATISCNSGPSNWAAGTFNLTTGALVKYQYSGTITLSGLPQIYPAANGWYRIYISIANSAPASGNCNVAVSNTDNPTYGTYGDYSYAGDGTSGIYIYGFNQVSNPISSYIQTTSAAGTRNSDNLINSYYAWTSYSIVAETTDEASGITSRNFYTNGSFSPQTNKWYRRICVYPQNADITYLANQAINIGQACY
jgi:hypothetical protein